MQSEQNVWLVTGAASGIGAAVTRAVRSRGMNVWALDIDQSGGAEIARASGATFLPCDVSNPASWQQVLAQIDPTALPTRIHLNAGIQIAPPDAPLSEYAFDAMTIERYRRMMGVNVDGVVFGLQALWPHLRSGASIVVTASLAGITPYAIDPLYAMSKHAVVGLVRSLAPALAERNIRINALCPGGIDTAIIPLAQRVPQAVLMTAEHIAAEVIRLMDVPETGKSWAKVAEDKPAFIVRAPGDRSA